MKHSIFIQFIIGIVVGAFGIFCLASLDNNFQETHRKEVLKCEKKDGVLIQNTYVCVKKDSIVE